MNFCMGTASLVAGTTVLTGDRQIVRRSVGPLIEALNELGAAVVSTRNNGLPPVMVKGRLRGGRTRLRGIISQYVSSLLIHCPLIERDSELEVYDVHEKPYVQITMKWLDRQGIRYEAADDMSRFKIFGGQSYHGQEVTIPGDFSSATFFLIAGVLCDADITLLGLDMDDVQGDKKVVTCLQEMGAPIRLENGGVRVRQGASAGDRDRHGRHSRCTSGDGCGRMLCEGEDGIAQRGQCAAQGDGPDLGDGRGTGTFRRPGGENSPMEWSSMKAGSRAAPYGDTATIGW